MSIPEESNLILKTTKFFEESGTLEDAVDAVFQHYREIGYPHYTITEEEKKSHMKTLMEFDYDSIFKGGDIIQTMHALRLAWSYFPHAWEVKCGASKFSPMDNFTNDELFKKTISKCLKWTKKHGSGRFKENRLRQSLKIYSGVQSVSNFRPTASGVIYKKYGGGGSVWDMSAGWGGRLIGALASKEVKLYIGTEPSTKTFEGLCKIKDDFSYLGKEVRLYCQGSEDFEPEEKSLDLCFTSPPYFDTERYADEETQSYKKFPEKQSWGKEFLQKTFKNCYIGLKEGGHMIINIANTTKHKDLEEMTISHAIEIGFKHVETLYLILSSVSGGGYKKEPVFVFRK